MRFLRLRQVKVGLFEGILLGKSPFPGDSSLQCESRTRSPLVIVFS